MKKLYKIRHKPTGKFVSLGYNSKSTWRIYPSEAISYSREIQQNMQDYEIVVYTYVEDHSEPLKELKQK